MVAEAFEGKRILVVEDDREMLTALQLLFEDMGAVVETAIDGNAAITVAVETEPDVIVLDAMLPKRSGFLVLEKLKGSAKKGKKPIVVMITGNEGKRHQVWAESLGVDGYLTKPFRMEKLVSAIEGSLSN